MKISQILSFLLATATLIGSLSACNTPPEETDTEIISSTESVTQNTEPTETASVGEETDETDTESDTEPDITPKLEGANALLIENAERLFSVACENRVRKVKNAAFKIDCRELIDIVETDLLCA